MITPEQFAAAMKKLGLTGSRPKIAVAVSGGGDSLALAVLLREWMQDNGGEMLALTVDHGLRPGSGAEAAEVGGILRAHGINHEILRWEGEKPPTHVQELAREARYALLLQACRARGFPALAVAHNLEDQAETFWMRLAHGSGLDGLSAMAPVRETEGVAIIRPLLGFSRAALRATCALHQVQWIEDPSNSNEKFLRVRLRGFEELLAGEGLTPARLAQTLQKLEDARDALQLTAEKAAAACLQFHPEGYATLKLPAWREHPRDIQRRVLGTALADLAAAKYPPGFDALEQTRCALLAPGFAGKTLSGCEIFPGPDGEVLIAREARCVEGRITPAEGRVWDGRFRVSGFGAESWELGALGETGLAALRKNISGFGALTRQLEALPFKVKRVLPALWQGENLLAVPHVSYYSPAAPLALKTGRVSFVKIV